MPPKKFARGEQGKMSAVLEFSEFGFLEKVYLNATTDQQAEILKKSLTRLIRPSYSWWVRKVVQLVKG